MDQVVLIHAYFSTSSYQAVYSERAQAGCRHSGCVSATTAFTVSVGFLKSPSLRVELSFIPLLTLTMFFFTSTFNTVKIVLKYYENVGIVIYVSLCLSYKQLWPSWHHFTFSETHRHCPCQVDHLKCREKSSSVDRSTRHAGYSEKKPAHSKGIRR